jgi:hypothetical protein
MNLALLFDIINKHETLSHFYYQLIFEKRLTVKACEAPVCGVQTGKSK